MLEILQYATSGFWVFVGCFSLLVLAAATAVDALTTIVNLFRRRT